MTTWVMILVGCYLGAMSGGCYAPTVAYVTEAQCRAVLEMQAKYPVNRAAFQVSCVSPTGQFLQSHSSP